MVAGFRNGQSLSDPVDGGVRGAEPGESKDNVFSSTAHNVEEMFLGNPFDVGVEGASVADCTGFVCGLIDVLNGDGGGEFLGGELVFSDKLPVNARDVGTRINQCGRVDDFEGVRGSDQLYGNMHRFVQS